ncbi:MAG: hypothetical protein ILP16_06960 [Spirochaetales bacterium]|nr:hypothetical protein [Spirochaetales bacterium]
MRHYLVDFENVNDEGLREIGALQKDCCIHIFFSASTARISLEYLTLMRNASVKAHKVSDDSYSLDVHIATTLGYLIGADAEQQDSFFIVSSGHDFSELVRFWGRRGVNIHMITIRERRDGYERPTAFRQAASAVPRPVQVRPLSRPMERPAGRPMERRPRPDFTRPERPRPAAERPAPVYVEPKVEPAPVVEHVEPAQPVQAEPELKPEPVFEPVEAKPVVTKPAEVAPEPDVKHITPAEVKDPVKVIPVRSADGVLQIKTDRPDSEIFTPDVLRFVNRTLSGRADEPNLKQIVYMAIVSKYGQKKGLAIYRQIKDFVEE